MQTFEEAHPELVDSINRELGSLDKLNKYQDYKGERVIEQWERDENGVLVDVTDRVKAEYELEEAKRALAILLGGSDGT